MRVRVCSRSCSEGATAFVRLFSVASGGESVGRVCVVVVPKEGGETEGVEGHQVARERGGGKYSRRRKAEDDDEREQAGKTTSANWCRAEAGSIRNTYSRESATAARGTCQRSFAKRLMVVRDGTKSGGASNNSSVGSLIPLPVFPSPAQAAAGPAAAAATAAAS